MSSNAWGEIHNVVLEAMEQGIIDAELAKTPYGYTDRIIALVREAMLSDAAVEAGARSITADPNFGTNLWSDDARNVLRAALSAAFGPASDQHGEGTARLEIGGTFEITDHFDVPDVVHIATRPDAGTAGQEGANDDG